MTATPPPVGSTLPEKLAELDERHADRKRQVVAAYGEKPEAQAAFSRALGDDPFIREEDMVGRHNANLAASTIRIIKGGSWKNQSTVIVLPAAKMVPLKAAMAWMHMIQPPNQTCPKLTMLGLEVGEAYSQAVESILATPSLANCRFMLTIEHDNVPPQDGFLRLLELAEAHPEFAAIGGLYWTKGPAGVPQIWGDPRDGLNFRPQPADPNGGLVECNGTAMGFTLFRIDMLKDRRLPRPMFKTKASVAEGVGTQDLSFWTEARKLGYRCAIACDVRVGHYDPESDVTW